MLSHSVVKTTAGDVQGYYTGSCHLFAGIPYAAAPSGDLRFRPPESPEPWTGVRDATYFGPIQPQSPSRFELFYGPDPQPQSEDSLRLNVWTPGADDQGRPVLLFIHGGAFVSGSGSLPMYHGGSFATRHDMVAVSINYRLAEGGSLYLGHLDPEFARSGNIGLLDQIAALQWVRDNIAAFGGDPNNVSVTICGQSAGGHAVLALMTSPLARGLFHRAIGQSLARLTPLRTRSEAIETTDRFMTHAGVHTIAELQQLDVETLLETRRHVMQTTPFWQTPWGTLVDDDVMVEQPVEAAAAGRLAPVPLLIGACHDDYQPYPHVLPPSAVPREEAAVIEHFDRVMGDGADLLSHYREWLGPVEPLDIFVAAMGDITFNQPAIRFAERHAAHAPVYAFDFKWASPVRQGAMGAGHTVEIPYAMHTIWTPHTPYHLGDAPSVSLADHMHEAWSTFARHGKPSATGIPEWPLYGDDERLTMELDHTSSVQRDPQADRRLYWADRL